jgi:hypothetical protein
MLVMQFDTTELVKKLDNMTKQIEVIPHEMYIELDEWQTEDVHFRRPFTRMVDDHTVQTVIWPRRHRRPHLRKRFKISVKQAAKIAQHRVRRKAIAVASNRPVLRDFLYRELVDRMTVLLENVKWQ